MMMLLMFLCMILRRFLVTSVQILVSTVFTSFLYVLISSTHHRHGEDLLLEQPYLPLQGLEVDRDLHPTVDYELLPVQRQLDSQIGDPPHIAGPQIAFAHQIPVIKTIDQTVLPFQDISDSRCSRSDDEGMFMA